MRLEVTAPAGAVHGRLCFSETSLRLDARCTIGRTGIVSASAKQEGDGATPAGSWSLRALLYRPDREPTPETNLAVTALSPTDGWCDDPAHPAYNTAVTLPFAASHEALWREDHAYDLVMVLGYNDAPAQPGKGSAIFMHLLHEDGRATAGCVAVSRAVMTRIVWNATPDSALTISLC